MTDQTIDTEETEEATESGITLTVAERKEAKALGLSEEQMLAAKTVDLTRRAAAAGWTVAELQKFTRLTEKNVALGHGMTLDQYRKVRGKSARA
jgi:hypothetical protein